MTPVFLHVKFIGNKLSVTDPDLAQNGFQSADFFSWLFCCTIQITLHRNIQVQLCNKKLRLQVVQEGLNLLDLQAGWRTANFLCIPRFMCFFFMARRYSALRAPPRLAPCKKRPWFEIFFAKKYFTKTAMLTLRPLQIRMWSPCQRISKGRVSCRVTPTAQLSGGTSQTTTIQSHRWAKQPSIEINATKLNKWRFWICKDIIRAPSSAPRRPAIYGGLRTPSLLNRPGEISQFFHGHP